MKRVYENGQLSESVQPRNLVFEEQRDPIPMQDQSNILIHRAILDDIVIKEAIEQNHPINELVKSPQDELNIPIKRSQRIRKYSILNDYVVYVQEHEYDIGVDAYPITF